MDEVVSFIRESGADAIIQEAYEFQRHNGSLWIMSGPGYDKNSLKKSDPPHWTSNDRKGIPCLNSILLPQGYFVCQDWRFEVVKGRTDSRGWMYMQDFSDKLSTSVQCFNSQVRYRKWQRIVLNRVDGPQIKHTISEFVSVKSHFRSLCAPLIRAALSKYDFHIQMVMECQRLCDGDFSAKNLSCDDPPAWCSGTVENLTKDPTQTPLSQLQRVEATIFNRGNGWDVLHEFIFTMYPNKDSQGWEYNADWSLDHLWSPKQTRDSVVRRRLWIRTCVKNNHLSECRDALHLYIENHPRGVFKTGRLERQSHFRKRWSEGLAVLTDHFLELTLENNYQSHVVYGLKNCEVVSIESGGSSDRKYQFGMRQVGSGGSDEGLVCVLNAASEKDRQAWITALSHQIALVNLLFWPLEIGPPTADRVLFKGEMWKRGHMVPNWKFRTFELRQGGTLAYFKHDILKGKIRLRGCEIRELPSEGEFAFEVVKKDGYSIALRTTDALTKSQWIHAIHDHLEEMRSPTKITLPLQVDSTALLPQEHVSHTTPGDDAKQHRDQTGANIEMELPCPDILLANTLVESDQSYCDKAEEEEVMGGQKTEGGEADDFEEWAEHSLQQQQPSYERGSESIDAAHTPAAVSPVYCGGGGHDDFLDWLENETGVVTPHTKSTETVDIPMDENDSVKSDEGDTTAGRQQVRVMGSRRASTGPGVYVSRGSTDTSQPMRTHEIVVDRTTGRRHSVLDNKLAEQVEAGGIWEADDEDDESEEEDEDITSKRFSSFNAHTSRTSTLRVAFREGQYVDDTGDGSDEDKTANGTSSEETEGSRHNREDPKPNAISAMFGFIAKRRSSV